MPTQVPNVAKLKYLQDGLKAVQQCVAAPRADPAIVREWQYQIEVIEAMIDDYKQKGKHEPAS